MRREFYYASSDGATKIHGVEWLPDGEITAVLQICHGMVEYIERYDEFAAFLNARGYYVVGHDHLGHGKSVNNEDDHGHFPHPGGNRHVIRDIHKLRRHISKKYQNLPYFMMGHSMGSFLLRQYLTSYADGLSGAILMGTGYKSAALLTAGQVLCRGMAAVKGWQYRSQFVNLLGIGGYNRKFEPSSSKKDWVTSDVDQRDAYERDPLCSFTFTIGAYYQMFCGMKTLEKQEIAGHIVPTLPVLFVAGEDDPVGDFGKSVRKVYQRYKKNGMLDVQIKLYPNDRHEILNETDRQQVYEDLCRWLDRKKQ